MKVRGHPSSPILPNLVSVFLIPNFTYHLTPETVAELGQI